MKWYQKTWAAILFLFIFPPVGIFFIWKFHNWKLPVKIILSVFFGLVFLMAIIPSSSSSKSEDMTVNAVIVSAAPTQQPAAIATPAPTATPTPTNTPIATSSTPRASESTNQEKISLTSITSPVSLNENATVKITGAPNTDYSIAVYYSSSKSTASGLENKKSDANGSVSWTWKVGGKTKSGNYYLKINGGGSSLKVDFTVN